MKRKYIARLGGEFLVIVVGVLVALGVDDWRQYHDDRQLEEHLLDRLQAELLADASDLASARREVNARLWVLDAVLAELRDPNAAARLQPQRLEALQNPPLLDSLRTASGRGSTWTFDPVAEPLGRTFRLWPEFDLSDDAYQEMLATGSLGLIRDRELRSAMMRYYRVAEDQGGNERRAGEYQDRFEGALAAIGLTPGDPVTIAQFVSRARQAPGFPVEARLAQSRMRAQLVYYSNIDAARRDFEERLAAARRDR